MVVVYIFSYLWMLKVNFTVIPRVFFMLQGVRRSAFSKGVELEQRRLLIQWTRLKNLFDRELFPS
jgi:hypothetical protein